MYQKRDLKVVKATEVFFFSKEILFKKFKSITCLFQAVQNCIIINLSVTLLLPGDDCFMVSNLPDQSVFFGVKNKNASLGYTQGLYFL